MLICDYGYTFLRSALSYDMQIYLEVAPLGILLNKHALAGSDSYPNHNSKRAILNVFTLQEVHWCYSHHG